MEDIEKEVLNRYKLWQEFFKENLNDNKDANKNYLLCKDFNSSCSGCSGGCKGCGCRGCEG